jgi:DNA-binding XRE family transcriptional regulator
MTSTFRDEQLPPLLDERRLRSVTLDWRIQCGVRLRARREAFGWSQEQLAKLVGVRSTAVSKFELGIVAPKDSIRYAVACALLCEVADIWPPLDRNYVMSVARTVAA